jgi:tetratricopeptide (TPR) repeat protein
MSEGDPDRGLIPCTLTDLEPATLASRGLTDLHAERPASERDRWMAAGHALPGGDHEGRLNCFQEAARVDPKSVEAWRWIAQTLGEVDRWDDALRAIDEAQGLITDCDSFEAYDCWMDRARALVALRQFNEGIACCDAAASIRPGGCGAHEVKGLALHEVGRFQDAVECFERYIENAPYDQSKAWGWNCRAASLRRLGRHVEALESCERAVTLQPTCSPFWVTKGNCLRDLGKPRAALRAHSHAVTLWPEDWIAWYNRALVLEDLRDVQMAIQSFEECLKIVPPGEPVATSARQHVESLRTRLAES